MKKLIHILCTILLACILSACSEKEPTAICSECKTEYPEKYAISDFFGDEVCPDCAQEQIMFFTVQMADAFDGIENDGVYFTDYDFMLVATTMCNHCGEWAPAMLRDPVDEPICIDCINDAIQNKNVAKSLERYFEYG